jgi:3-hydroxyisobutyrate dehydrogenase-like beta-hydroxyacid dehydrogenase
VLGLGEAGARIAADLAAAGARVAGFDPVSDPPANVRAAADVGDAVAGADVVLSVNAASVAFAVARDASDTLGTAALYADLNTASPSAKQEIAAVVAGRGALFADVALMAPVPRDGLRTRCLVSGSGAAAYVSFCEAFGVPVEVAGAEPGDAAVRKLVRSVFMKGLAASALEALAAAEAAGLREAVQAEIASTLTGADGALLERLLVGSKEHAARRVHEMEASSELLRSLGVEPRISEAAAGWLRQLESTR